MYMVVIFHGDRIFMDFVKFVIHKFYIQVMYVIVRIVTPYFNSPILLSRSLVGSALEIYMVLKV